MASHDDFDKASGNNPPPTLQEQLKEMVDFFEQRSKDDLELEYDNSLSQDKESLLKGSNQAK